MRLISIIAIISLVSFSMCSRSDQKTQDNQPSQTPNLRVSVLKSDMILVEGTQVSLTDLDIRLAKLKEMNGIVWYYREPGEGDSNLTAMGVIDLIIKHQLPISFSSKPDFSDYIDEDGISHPRR